MCNISSGNCSYWQGLLLVRCSSFKGKIEKKCIRMAITDGKFSSWEVNCQFYGHKLHFTAPLMCRRKTIFATMKPTIYRPK